MSQYFLQNIKFREHKIIQSDVAYNINVIISIILLILGT